MLAQGVCSPTDDKEYAVMLSIVDGNIANEFMKGLIMAAGVGLSLATGGMDGGLSGTLAVAAVSAINFAAGQGLNVPGGAFYVGIPSQDRYLDVWGTVWNPQTGNGGSITTPHAPETPSVRKTTLIAAGTDSFLYTRTTLNSPWVKVENSCCVTGVTTVREVVFGVGLDQYIWKRDELDHDWYQIPNSCCVTGITTMPDQATLIGIDVAGYLWQWKLAAPGWTQLPNRNAQVIKISALPNHALIGVGVDNQLWTRKWIDHPWIKVPNSPSIISVAALPDGTIAVVGMDRRLYQMRTSMSPSWAVSNNDFSVQDITAGPLSLSLQ